jgi:hypothetical protein
MTMMFAVAAVTILLASQAATGSSMAIEQSVADVERRFEAALDKRDRAELESILTPQFMWVHAGEGRVDSRAVFIEQSVRGMGLTRQRASVATFERNMAMYDNTVIATSRVRNRFPDGARETWIRQTRIYVKEAGHWKLAHGQGTRMYDGPVSDARLYERYAGTYALPDGRVLKMEWDGDSLLAELPSSSRMQVFLKSPTEEATTRPDRYVFVLDEAGRPQAVRFLRGEMEIWRAERRQ